jgi:hypothetical protein
MSNPKSPINLDDIDFGHTLRGHQKGDRVFDRFVLEKLLGRGGMGVVWLAKDERLGREVALKFAPEAVRFDDLAVDELKEETRKGLELAHPNIVKIYDFLMDEEHAAISMEFIDGENLGTLRARQPRKIFETSQLSQWVDQLLDALDYAHRGAKVIHRDLKPANLMVDREGNLRVTDFGIARSISDAMTRATLNAGNSTGTLAYMSPQQADGKKPHVSDDLYALGSTLYELLTGKPPFFSGNIAARLHEEAAAGLTERRNEFGIIGAEPIPPEWEHTVLALLEKMPENRPSGAEAVRQQLGLSGPPTTSVPPLPPMTGGGATALHVGPQTGVGGTQTHVRSGAGLTEVNLSGRPILAGNIRVGPGAAVPEPTTPQTAAPSSGGGLWIALIAGVMGLIMMAGAGWWVWNRTSIFKPKPTQDSPLVHQPAFPADNPHKTADPGKTITPAIPPTPPTLPKVSAIQTLINEAKPGSEVVVPEGNYEEQLHFREGIKLKAAPGARVIVQTDGRVGAALLVENCKTGSISGIIFQHTGSEVVQNVSWPVVLVKSSSITLENCTVQSGVSDGMIITGVGSPQVLRCTVKNNAKNGIVFEAGVTGTLVATECRLNGASGVELRNSGTRPTIQSCALVDNQLAGISVKDGAAVSVLEKTRCQGNKDAGMAAAGEGVELTVVDAICESNVVGIAVQDYARGSIRDSTIRDSESHGIQFGMTADGTEVVKNTIIGSKGEGMLITGANGRVVTITGNKVSDSGADGIGVFGAGFKPKVENNECLKNAGYGILAVEGVSGIIRENTVRDNHAGAISHDGAAADLQIEGNITDGK